MQRYGTHRGRQQYKCRLCLFQFINPRRQERWIKTAYHRYSSGKQTLSELSATYKKSTKTLRRYFDKCNEKLECPKLESTLINLVFDATFFTRSDGFLVFRADKINIHWQAISSETLEEISSGLDKLDKQGYRFKSITIDGRRGVIKLLEARYPNLPIQMCQFHQTQIIRRYTTNNPKTDCGKDLKILMRCITEVGGSRFKALLETLYEIHEDFLKEKNEEGQFKHPRLRSAFRSLKTNLPYLFNCKQFPELAIPNTTNSCDGSFAHWKQKVKIHRGLRKERRDKMINYLLAKPKKP